MNREVWALPRAINRKIPQGDDPHFIKMRIGRTKEFAADFGGRVRTQGLGEMFLFRKWYPFGRSIHGRTGCENEAFNSGGTGALAPMKCAGKIGVVIELRLLNRRPNAGSRRQMRDGVKFLGTK